MADFKYPVPVPVPELKSERADLLDEAKSLITGDRNSQYGPPTQDFDRTAALANAAGFRIIDASGNHIPLKGHHVGTFMMLLKISRSMWSDKRDHYVDIAGYVGCAWECVVNEKEEK